MKGIVSLAAGVALCALAPNAANAQSTVSTITGTVTVQKGSGPELDCTATIGLDGATPATSSNVTSISLSGGFLGLCATVQFPNTPHSITQGGGTFTVNDVYADTTFTPGDCEGDIAGTISGGTVSVNASLPQVSSGGACTIVGTLS
tara:strand:- start:780 stop:1220 length:441 start_codon:yes stop_codon:yes gene_type:complete